MKTKNASGTEVGVETVRAKINEESDADVSKCAKIRDMFAAGATAVTSTPKVTKVTWPLPGRREAGA